MNKTIVITGGSGGLGSSLVRLFRDNKDNVCSLSRSDNGSCADFFYCDVTDEKSVTTAVSSVAEKYGGFDVLILCSGIGLAGSIEETPTEVAKKVMDVNFYGALHTVRAAIQYMKKDGRIIAVSSASAFFSLPYRNIYSASKSALNIIMNGLRMELSPHIKVCSVCPGEIDTPFVENRLWYSGEKDKNALNKISADFKQKQKGRMNADKVAKKIYAVIAKNNPKPFYIIGAKYKLFYYASRLLPTGLLLKITSKRYGGKA